MSKDVIAPAPHAALARESPASSAHGSLPRSLEDVHHSVAIPASGSPWRRLFAFTGPAYLVAVGYMDPGNWATDIGGGASFGYKLLWVLLMSNLMAVLLQTLCARLGLVTGRDLAQACRESYNPVIRWVLFILCEIAIAACDLAEVLGTAIGLNLLTAQFGMFGGEGIPLIWAVLITGLDVFLLLAIQRFGIRKMEAFIFSLISIIGMCFIVQLFLSKPSPAGIARGLVPSWLEGKSLYIAIGILGATVMPHNLYLHSALVQSRNVRRTKEGIRQAMRFNFIDSAIALNCAFFVNAAILIVAAATFYSRGVEVSEIQDAHRMLDQLLGSKIAPMAFAIALICAGQSSTITGTLAGQITMEGFLHFRMRPWLRRLITRSLAIAPAVAVIAYFGESGTGKLLVLSQVILSLQLPFAVIPLIKFTGSRSRMGEFATGKILLVLAWITAVLIVSLNAKLVVEQIAEWSESAGAWRPLVLGVSIPSAVGLGALLLYLTFRTEHGPARPRPLASPARIAEVALVPEAARRFRRVGVALEAKDSDAAMLAEAVALARLHGAELVLMHVVEGAGGQWLGQYSGDAEAREDEVYIRELTERLSEQLASTGGARAVLGFGGDVPRELVRLAKAEQIDVMVLGGHGHRGLGDILRGTTIDAVRHRLTVPVLAVRQS